MYAGLVKTAQALIAKFGTARTLARTTQGAFDPLTGTYASTTTDHTVNGVEVNINFGWGSGRVGSLDYKFNIETGDGILLVAAGVIEPQAGDSIDGQTVVAVETVKPADVAVLYKVQVRAQ